MARPYLLWLIWQNVHTRQRYHVGNLIHKYGLPMDFTEMDLLRVTGGRLATDPYEFVHPVFIQDNYFELDFYVAGWRHHHGENHLEALSNDTNIVFEKEQTNEHDPFAIMVKTDHGVLQGYVPAFFSEFMTDVINNGFKYNVKIEKIDKATIPQLRVNLIVNGNFLCNEKQYPSMSNNLIPVQYI